MKPVLRTLALSATLVVAVALSSCGTSSTSGAAGPETSGRNGAPTASGTPSPVGPPASGTPYPVGPPASGTSNASDVDFAMAMTMSHLQAGAIADLAPQHAKDNKITALASKVKKAQGPEVTAMAGWLVGGGIPVPDASGGHDMSGMGGAAMKVVISPAEMTALGKATGSGFDRMWLQLMLKSHQAAVATARTELAQGVNAGAKKLAQSVIERQSAEIATMTSILTGLARP